MEMTPRWERALEAICERVAATERNIGDAWPYHADPDSGHWQTTEDGDWCGGHWVECLRIVGTLTGDSRLIARSRERAEQLRPYLEKDDQFRGHRFYYGTARQYDESRKESDRTLALAAAYAMRSMAIPANGGMPIGFQVQVKSTSLASRSIVACDNVHPNLCLDWWAWQETGDETFLQGARRHLDLTIADFVRDDGSTIEFIEYDRGSGRPVREFTLLGAHDQSCWSRGQAWVIAGFLRAWEHLGTPAYLHTARKTFDYWWSRSSAGGVPPWDFMDPLLETKPSSVPLDTSASAIVIEQLARLAVQPEKALKIPDVIDRLPGMIDGLLSHLTPTNAEDLRSPGRLLNGCFNQPRRFASHSELIWGTAYLLFGLFYLKTGSAPR
jgi:unsaturated chondroitin disaccharide hydrolase